MQYVEELEINGVLTVATDYGVQTAAYISSSMDLYPVLLPRQHKW